MKKLLLSFLLMSFTNLFSQCVITGSNIIKVLDVATYTVENDNAQCKDCHLWMNLGENTSLEGDVKQNTIKLKANSIGKTILSLSMLSPQGLVQCNKSIEVVEAISNKSETDQSLSNCDIDFTDFKELKYDVGIVAFLPAKLENNYKNLWTVTYENGEQKTSTEKVPQFNYSKENEIVTVVAKVSSSKCVKNFTKTYEKNFWKFF
jgi:hypothetical protein